MQARGHDVRDVDRYWQTGLSMSAGELLEPVRAFVDPVLLEDIDAGPSHDLTVAAMLALVAKLRGLAATKVAGAVVSLGSNGLEEVAFLAWMFGAPVPVVLTASMRPPTALGSDALSNLVDAFSVAKAEATRPHGVVIVSDGAILHPADAFKSHSSRVDSFRASSSPIGWVTKNAPRFDGVARPGPLCRAPLPEGLAPVGLVTTYIGADGSAIRAAVDGGARGIVSAGAGGGFPTGPERRALLAAVESGVVVCQAQRTPHGVVTPFTGPFLSARSLSPQKARLVLAVALARVPGMSVDELQDLLDLASGERA